MQLERADFMFFNLKINGNKLVTTIFIVIFIVMIIILSIGIYNIFFKEKNSNTPNDVFTLDDCIKANDIFEITPENYTNILQTVTNDIDSYVGLKIHFTGYVYRLLDFEEDEFVLARQMRVNPNSNQTLVVGFLSFYDKAKNFEDGTWVDVTGEIVKGNYYGDIAEIRLINMFEIEEPIEALVNPPDDTYIPTSNMF